MGTGVTSTANFPGMLTPAYTRSRKSRRRPMPAVSERQRRFMGADYARAKAGQKTRTGMNESQLRDFARKKARNRGQRRAIQNA
jgi:hypothetical protein